MSTPAVFDGDEVWDAEGSSSEDDIDSDLEDGLCSPVEPQSPTLQRQQPFLRLPGASPMGSPSACNAECGSPGLSSADATAPGVGMANLVGRLRCDNLKLREVLVEAQRETEAMVMALHKEREERRRLAAEAEHLRAQLREAEAARRLSPCEEGEEPPEDTEAGEQRTPEKQPGDRRAPPAADEQRTPEAQLANGKADEQSSPCENGEQHALEKQLVSCKVRCAEAVERAEGLEALVEHYEGQLRTLNPAFQPVDLRALERPRRPSLAGSLAQSPRTGEADASGQSPAGQTPVSKEKSSGKRRIKKWAGRMFRAGSGGHHAAGDAEGAAASVPGPTEDMARQREVISCLMAELEKANETIHRFKAKASKRKSRKAAEATAAA